LKKAGFRLFQHAGGIALLSSRERVFCIFIAIHLKSHTVLRRLSGFPIKIAKPFLWETCAVPICTVFG